MRTAHKVWCGIAAGAFCLVAISDLSGPATTPTTAAPAAVSAPAPAAPTPANPGPAVAPAAPATPAAASGARSVTVSDVVDGDTFVAGGKRVRVLGIDSCEMSTYGGEQAKSTADMLLEGQTVVLRAEPGVDEDRNGRQLRYVELASGMDYAESMVVHDHTGVYEGRNDAAEGYVQGLRDDDPNGRDCATPAAASPSSGDDGSVVLPRPGDQGMRDGALSGGYCKKKWWC